jgi:hypothetical protein
MVEVGMSVIWLLGLVMIFVLSLPQGTTTASNTNSIFCSNTPRLMNAVAEEEVERLITEGKSGRRLHATAN